MRKHPGGVIEEGMDFSMNQDYRITSSDAKSGMDDPTNSLTNVEDTAFRAIKWARDLPLLTDGRGALDERLRYVALVLATYADGRTGRNVRPALDTLMAKTGLAETTLRRVLERGERAGLWASEGTNSYGVECWHLCLDADLDTADTATKRHESKKERDAKRQAEYRKAKRARHTISPATEPVSHHFERDTVEAAGQSDVTPTSPVTDAESCHTTSPVTSHHFPCDSHTVSSVTSHRFERDVTGETAGTSHRPARDLPKGELPGRPTTSAAPPSEPAPTLTLVEEAKDDTPPPLAEDEVMLNFDAPPPPVAKKPRAPRMKKTRNTTSDEAFEAAWIEYGALGGKQKAFDKWRAALKVTDLDDLLAGMRAYIGQTRHRGEPDRQGADWQPARQDMSRFLEPKNAQWADALERTKLAPVVNIRNQGSHEVWAAKGPVVETEAEKERKARARAKLWALNEEGQS